MLRGEGRLAGPPRARGRADGHVPGARVVVDGREYRVHGITHAGTAAERSVLREGVAEWPDAGAAVHCEQGIRSMYFGDRPAVYGTDDYRWAMAQCRRLGIDSHVEDLSAEGFDGLAEQVDSLAATFREAAFSLVDAGDEVYGERFGAALGDVTGALLTSHEDAATGEDFESFVLSRRAAGEPDLPGDLQRYYERRFLPARGTGVAPPARPRTRGDDPRAQRADGRLRARPRRGGAGGQPGRRRRPPARRPMLLRGGPERPSRTGVRARGARRYGPDDPARRPRVNGAPGPPAVTGVIPGRPHLRP